VREQKSVPHPPASYSIGFVTRHSIDFVNVAWRTNTALAGVDITLLYKDVHTCKALFLCGAKIEFCKNGRHSMPQCIASTEGVMCSVDVYGILW